MVAAYLPGDVEVKVHDAVEVVPAGRLLEEGHQAVSPVGAELLR